MKEVKDRIVQYPNRYELKNVATGEVMGAFDFTEKTGTVVEEGTEINAELFKSIDDDIKKVESAYVSAKKGGYTDTQDKFYKDLASIQGLEEALEALL